MTPPAEPPVPPVNTQASRVYFLPNLMTAGNLFCGFLAIIKCIQARLATSLGGEYLGNTPAELYTHAVWFILGAVCFDMLDGRLARLGGRESLFGAEFDSLADVVSFGVAPALMLSNPADGRTVLHRIFNQGGNRWDCWTPCSERRTRRRSGPTSATCRRAARRRRPR
jgi:hypothetical protein